MHLDHNYVWCRSISKIVFIHEFIYSWSIRDVKWILSYKGHSLMNLSPSDYTQYYRNCMKAQLIRWPWNCNYILLPSALLQSDKHSCNKTDLIAFAMETCVLIPQEFSLVLTTDSARTVTPASPAVDRNANKLPEMRVNVWTNTRIPQGTLIYPFQGTIRLDKLEVYSCLDDNDVSTVCSFLVSVV